MTDATLAWISANPIIAALFIALAAAIAALGVYLFGADESGLASRQFGTAGTTVYGSLCLSLLC